MTTQKQRRRRRYEKAAAIAGDVRSADFPEAVTIIAGLLGRAEADRHRVRELQHALLETRDDLNALRREAGDV